MQADDPPFAARPFEDAGRDAGALDRLAARKDDRVAIGFSGDRDLAFAAHRDFIVAKCESFESLELRGEMMVAVMREISFDAARLEYLGVRRKQRFDA